MPHDVFRDRYLQKISREAFARTRKARIDCKQCRYDRVQDRSCAWCGATGKQRGDEVSVCVASNPQAR